MRERRKANQSERRSNVMEKASKSKTNSILCTCLDTVWISFCPLFCPFFHPSRLFKHLAFSLFSGTIVLSFIRVGPPCCRERTHYAPSFFSSPCSARWHHQPRPLISSPRFTVETPDSFFSFLLIGHTSFFALARGTPPPPIRPSPFFPGDRLRNSANRYPRFPKEYTFPS